MNLNHNFLSYKRELQCQAERGGLVRPDRGIVIPDAKRVKIA
jgi:hypothetical protein